MRHWVLATLFSLGACQGTCDVGQICVVMGSGDLGFNGDGLPALESRIASPTAVRESPTGDIVVVDYSNMRLRMPDADNVLTTIAGNGIHAYSEAGTHILDTPLENPVDASWGPDGLLYILPQHEGRVIRVEEDQTVSIYAGTGRIEDGDDQLPWLDTSMGFGGGMSWGPDGSLYVSDASFSRVRRIRPDGTVERVLGVGSAGQTPLGFGPETAIAFPERVTVDHERNRLLIADTGNHRVLAMDLETLTVELICGTGARGYAGDGGPAADALLDGPVGVEVTTAGTVLVGDIGNNVLRAVSPEGIITTVAGTDDEYKAYDRRPPLRFPLRQPGGMAWTSNGDLLIAERAGHRILRWTGAADVL